jgi:hypothetical protein
LIAAGTADAVRSAGCAAAQRSITGRYEVPWPENFVHDVAQIVDLMVCNADKHDAVTPQKLPKQDQTEVHHAKPLVMAGQVFGFGPHHLGQPLPYFRAVDGIVVNPVLVAGVVGGSM